MADQPADLPQPRNMTAPFGGGSAAAFAAWIAEIEANVTFDVDTELWHKYFEAGLSPLQAIEQNRTDEEI